MDTLIKQPSESRLYELDFAPLMVSGEIISSVGSFVATPTGLTLDTATNIGAKKIQKRVSGGAVNVLYKLTAVVTTSAGNILEGDGYLQVKEL